MNPLDYEQLTLFPADSRDRASRLVLPGSEEARKTTVTSGLKCCELYKNSGPLGSLVKMLLESSIWRSTRCYLTWKASATPAKRLLFRLAPSMPRTKGNGAQLLPTPTAQDGKNSTLPPSQKNRGSLPGYLIRMYPTPRSSCAHGPSNAPNRQGAPDLQTVVSMFPTPTTGAGLCGGTGNYQQLMKLREAGVITEEERRNMSQGNGGQLNPDWVEWLMAFPPGWTDIG